MSEIDQERRPIPHTPRPCEKCGSTNISVTRFEDHIELRCNDCGYTWERQRHHWPRKDEPETPET